MATIEELQAAVLGIPGVVGAVVGRTPEGRPTVRVWTDDTRDPEDLQADVRALLARARALEDYEAESATVVPEPKRPSKKSGLGRGLDALFSDSGEEPAAGHLLAIDLSAPPALDMIAIEESASGVTVRAVDTARNMAETKVIGGSGSINPAIVAAVAELTGELPPPRLASVELRDTEAAAVLVVTLELADTTIAAGAAVVQGGMPFTLGKAAWAAIRSARP